MPSSNSPVLQQLDRLDKSSSDFHDQLCNTIYGEEYVRCVPDLEGDDLVWLVEYLDKAFGDLDPSSPASQKCLRELRGICGTRAILPTSYIVSPNLLNVGPNPFTGGGYGDVYEGTFNGSKVCVKRIRVYTEDPRKVAKTFCQEAVMWKRLTHPNVLPLLGVTINCFQLISDWMSGGDLLCYIKNNSDADRLGLLSDIAKGLCYLHTCNVIHGDLKGPNILVDNSGHARITDFGLATVTENLDSIRSAHPQRGHTVRWAAPEILDERPHSKEADIFSFAMVMIEVFTGGIPFSGHSTAVAMLAITQGNRPPRPTHPSFTDNLWILIQRCWNHDPQLRPEVSEALQVLFDPEEPAWKQLTSRTLATHERISLITAIFSDRDQVKMVENLIGNDAQNFIDVIDEALDSLEPQIRMRCLRPLYRICGRQALLPRSLAIPLCYDPTKPPQYCGGFTDVWKCEYRGRQVVAKVLRVYIRDDLRRIGRMFCREVMIWKTLCHPNVLPLLGVTVMESRFVMVSEWMENGNINEFVKANINADRLGLLRDVTRGLIYMHAQGIVYGNIKGAHILIDRNNRALLAGFALISLASDQETCLSSCVEGGTIRWMTPELLDPERFGLKGSHPTKETDCYMLGMVIYEVLSGQTPFAPSNAPTIIRKILDGERPERPQGNAGKLFTDGIWSVVQRCWMHRPRDRISAKDILLGLEGSPTPLRPPSDVDKDVETDTSDQSDDMATNSGLPIPRGGDGLPAPPLSPPPSASARPMIPQDGAPFQDRPQTGIAKGGRIGDRLARSAREMFKAVTRKFFGP